MKACIGTGHITSLILTLALQVSGQSHVPVVYPPFATGKKLQVFTEEEVGCCPEPIYIKGTQSYATTKPASQTQ